MSDSTRIDFLYLSEKDVIEAGVLDGKKCIDCMSEVMDLLSAGDYRLGGEDANSHGIFMSFPKESEIEGMPLDHGHAGLPWRKISSRGAEMVRIE